MGVHLTLRGLRTRESKGRREGAVENAMREHRRKGQGGHREGAMAHTLWRKA